MGFVCIFTGEGKGKTFSAFGMAMRFMGFGKKVVVIQFMKGRKSGEVALRKHLPQLEIIQFGTGDVVDLKKPKDDDIQNAKEALFYSKRLLTRVYRPDLLIMDEVNTALAHGFIEESAVMEIINNLPEKTNLVLTGEGATGKMVERADIVTEMRDMKKSAARKGGRA